MKKQILMLTMCLALTATSTLAAATNKVVQKTKPATIAKPSAEVKSTANLNSSTNVGAPKSISKEEAKKHFEEKMLKHREHMYSELGLSAEQKLKAEALDLKSKTEIEPLITKAQAEAKKLRELKCKKASVFEIWKQENAFKAAKKDVKKHMIASRKSFEAILTDEQKVKFNSIRAEKKKEIDKFKKSHKPHGPKCKCPECQKHEHMGPPPEDMRPEGPQDHGPMPFPPKGKE